MEAAQAAPEIPHVTYPRFTTRIEVDRGHRTNVYDRQHWHASFRNTELAKQYAEWANSQGNGIPQP